ncbi:MAG: sugar transferase [Bacteroidales bacterium]|nr:sugar transferase [Bacteroidales bacterium]
MEKMINLLYIGNSAENIERLKEKSIADINISENILKAVNLLHSGQKIDAIICELMVPGGSGFSMYEWVREHYKSIPFILVAHEFKDELFREAFNRGIDDLYITPLPPAKDLTDRIRFLSNYRSRSEMPLPETRKDLKYRMPVSKRIFDIAVASTVLILISPVLLLIALAIRLESKGKVYYISRRVGRKPFDFYKLRSMRTGSDAELNKLAREKNQYNNTVRKREVDFSQPCPRCALLWDGKTCSPLMHIGDKNICDYWYNFQKKEIARNNSAFIKIADDPRITKVGKLIRNTSIDELPQLINVLKGDMSIVGNRPLPVYEAELLTIDTMSKRFLAPAGITGLWQVELRGRGGEMSEEERKRLDNEYANHFAGDSYSFWYDIRLILRTVPALFQKDTV